ncbi:MAG TPA: plasmid pRiA4b ORF-3 family protein [Firmicutes bacterium]|nr:plasmid pRiA4b ORF-3 family protein [Candidatus Fermentithermobacillaceae bacterium]
MIVPADLEFAQLHKILQAVSGWRNYRLHDFIFFAEEKCVPVARLVPVEEGLYYDEQVIFERNILYLSFFRSTNV